MISNFGQRVIGKKAWEQQQKEKQRAAETGGKLGSRVTGPSRASRAAGQTTVAVAGPGGPPPAPPAADPDKAKPDDLKEEGGQPAIKPISVADMKEVLESDPSIEKHDQLFAAEMERPEGTPRKGALRLLLDAEMKRTEPRGGIIAELKQHLGEE
jgi:hypothetical protein